MMQQGPQSGPGASQQMGPGIPVQVRGAFPAGSLWCNMVSAVCHLFNCLEKCFDEVKRSRIISAQFIILYLVFSCAVYKM